MSFIIQRLLSSGHSQQSSLLDAQDETEYEAQCPACPSIGNEQPLNPFTEIQVIKRHSDLVRLLCTIDDERFAAVCDDNTVTIFHSMSGQVLHTLHNTAGDDNINHKISCVLPINRYLNHEDTDHQQQLCLAVAGSSKQLNVWDVESGQVCLQVTLKSSVKCMLPVSRNMMCVCGDYVSLVDAVTGDHLAHLPTTSLPPSTPPLSHTSHTDTDTSSVEAYHEQEVDEIRAALASATAHLDHAAAAVAPGMNEMQHVSAGAAPVCGSDIRLIIALAGSRLVAAMDNELVVFQYDDVTATTSTSTTGSDASRINIIVCRRLPQSRETITALINISEKHFCSGSHDGSIQLWSASGLHLLKSLNDHYPYISAAGHRYVFSVHFMTCVDKRYMLAAVGNGFIVYDMMNCRVLAHRANAHYSTVLCIQLMCDGYYMCTCSEDGSIRVWGNGEHILSVSTNTSAPSSHGTTSDIDRLLGPWKSAVQSGELEACVPDLLGECLAHSGTVQTLLQLDRHAFVSSGADGLVITWKDGRMEEIMRRAVRT